MPGQRRQGIIVSLVAILLAIVAAGIWGLLRAYTGIFDVLNLRVFVASFVLIAPLIAIVGVALSLTGAGRIFLIFVPFLAMVPVGGGEYLGAALSGRPIIWQKFNIVWLGIFIVFALLSCVGSFVKRN
jgi:hypothetical protein